MDSRSKKNRRLYAIILFLVLLLLSGCAFRRAEVIDPAALATKKVVFVYGIEDSLNLKESVRSGLVNLGFSITEKKEEADLVADFNYDCYWDVIHYTCRKFNFFITDIETKKVILQSKTWGDTPFGAEKLVSDLFEKVGEEVKKKTVHPGATY